MSRTIEAVIFDLDGVLVDSEPLHWRASQRLFAPHELTMEEYEPFVGLAIEPYMTWAREHFELDATVEELIEHYATAVTAEIESGPMPPLDGARELIAAARERGLRVGLASQSIASWVHPTLRAASLDEAFDVVVTGDDVARPKPRPDIYVHTARLLGVAPRSVPRDRGLAGGGAVGGRGRDARRAVAAGVERGAAAARRTRGGRLAARG